MNGNHTPTTKHTPSNNVVHILYFDRDSGTNKRPHKNVEALKQAVPSLTDTIHITSIQRSSHFPGESCMEDILKLPQFPYQAIVVNGHADHGQDAVLCALQASMDGIIPIPPERIFYIQTGTTSKDIEEFGAICVPLSGGNGHLAPQDAQYLLRRIVKE